MGCRTRRSARASSSARAPWSGTCERCSPSWASAPGGSSPARCRAPRPSWSRPDSGTGSGRDNFRPAAALVAQMQLRRALAALAGITMMLGAATADAAERDWRLRSPDGRLGVDVRLGAGLDASYRRDGARVVSAAIGLRAGPRCLPQGFQPVAHRRSTIAEHYTTPAGKRREHHHRARQLVLRFRRGRSRLTVAIRAADDGIAHRTTITGPARRRVTGECSSFTAPAGARAWLQRYGASYERPYLPTLLRDAPARS